MYAREKICYEGLCFVFFKSNFWAKIELHSEKGNKIGKLIQNQLHFCDAAGDQIRSLPLCCILTPTDPV